MEKGIVMRVQLYITGDDAPAHDFSQTGREVALQVLQQGLQHYQGPYAIQVQKLVPVEGGDDDDESGDDDALEVKPLLSYAPPSQQPDAPAAGTVGTQSAPSSPAPSSPAQQSATGQQL